MKPLTLIAFALLIVAALIFAFKDEQNFNQKVEQTRMACLADGESKWTCESVIESMQAKRAADRAAAQSNLNSSR